MGLCTSNLTLLASDPSLLQHARDEGNEGHESHEGNEEGHEAPCHEGCRRGGSGHVSHEGNEGHESHEEGHEAPRHEEDRRGGAGNEGHEGHEEVNGGSASCPCCLSAGDMNDA